MAILSQKKPFLGVFFISNTTFANTQPHRFSIFKIKYNKRKDWKFRQTQHQNKPYKMQDKIFISINHMSEWYVAVWQTLGRTLGVKTDVNDNIMCFNFEYPQS